MDRATPASIDRLLTALRRARDPPATLCSLRIAKMVVNGEERYVSSSSIDGTTFSRGAVWTHTLGASARLGLVAFGGGGFTARFDHVNAWSLPAPAAQ